MGPAIPINPRYQILCLTKEIIFAVSAIAANMGRSVFIKIPSYWAKNPIPSPLAKDPRAGKHDAHPIAAVSAPKAPVLSNRRVTNVRELFNMDLNIYI